MNKNISKIISDNYFDLENRTEKLIVAIKEIKLVTDRGVNIGDQVDSWISDVSKLILGDELEKINIVEAPAKLFLLKSKYQNEIDTFTNKIAVEYESAGELQKIDRKIIEYLDSSASTNGCDGFSTDGDKVNLFLWDKDKKNRLVEAHEFNKEVLINKVIPMLFNVGKRKLTTRNLIRDFLVTKCNTLNITALSQSLYKQLTISIEGSGSSKIKILYSEWKESFFSSDNKKFEENQKKAVLNKRNSLSKMVNDDINTSYKEYIALFSVYTAYSIFLKLVAYQILCNIRDIQDRERESMVSFFKQLESNEIFSNQKILNLLDGDYFQWYVELVDENKDLANRLKSIKEKLTCYEITNDDTLVADIFKNFYEEYVDFNIRHSLGEYFTPLWIADYCIKKFEESIENKEYNYKLIDNCCGSGAFLLAGINRKLDRGMDCAAILDSVVGIDINPLSALQARINYFIALYTKTKSIGITPIVIPIYSADSCNIPKKDTKFVYCELKTKYKGKHDKNYIFSVPLKIMYDKIGFFSALLNIEKIVESSSILNTDKFKLIYGELKNLIKPDTNEVKSFDEEERRGVSNFIDNLLELQKNSRSGIWVRIIANRIFAIELEENFDLVVGNPPWVRWSDLPEQYRKNLQNKADKYNLFGKNKFLGGNSLNICALISYIGLKIYGNKESKLIYIMPSDMIFQSSYEDWRKLNKEQYFEKYIHFQNKNIFKDVTMDFSIYVVNKSKQRNIEYSEVKLVKKNIEWSDIKTFSEIQKSPNVTIITFPAKELIPVRSDKTKFIVASNSSEKRNFEIIGGKSEYKVRSGLGLLPKEMRLFKLISFDKVNRIAKIESLDSIKNNFKNIISINSDYLFPVLTSVDMKEGNIDLNNKKNYQFFTFLPYDYQNKSKVSFNPVDLTATLGGEFFNKYISSASKKLSAQSQSSNQHRQGNSYGIQRIGEYTYHTNKVVLRDNTKFISSVITKQNFYSAEIQNRVPLLSSRISSISERIIVHGRNLKTELITKDEALFINAILNLSVVRRFVEKSNSPRGYELNDLGIYLPVLDRTNIFHKNILSKMKSNEYEEKQVLENYLKDCLKNNPYYANRYRV